MQAIPDFLATTDVGRRIPDVAEEDTQSWVSRREEMAEEKRLGGGLRWRNDSCALFLDAGPGEPQPYSHATYIDHGDSHFAQFSCPAPTCVCIAMIRITIGRTPNNEQQAEAPPPPADRPTEPRLQRPHQRR